jgi:hypothetical protein
MVEQASRLRGAIKLVLTTVGYGSLLYATQMLLPAGLFTVRLPWSSF